jgi:hypothetical protein
MMNCNIEFSRKNFIGQDCEIVMPVNSADCMAPLQKYMRSIGLAGVPVASGDLWRTALEKCITCCRGFHGIFPYKEKKRETDSDEVRPTEFFRL